MKNVILVVALLSLVACGGNSPTAPSNMPPTSSINLVNPSTGNSSADLADVMVKIWDHTFNDLGCKEVTIFFDGKRRGTMKHPYSKKIAVMDLGKYPEGSVHTLRAVSCRNVTWSETITVSWPIDVSYPFVN